MLAAVGTREERAAGTALIVFGVLNALLALVGLMGRGDARIVAFMAALGVLFVLLGLLVRDGSRPAIVASVVLLGLLLALELANLAADPDVQLVIWVLITGGLAYMVIRAQRSL